MQTVLGVQENLTPESLDKRKDILIDLLNPSPPQECSRFLDNEVVISSSAQYSLFCLSFDAPSHIPEASLLIMVLPAASHGG